jgi:4-amino-4-deoxy-L-arabinose transferase-like glycosyltransferase
MTDASPAPSERPRRATLLLVLLAVVLLFPSLFYPFARDQGVFAYVGSILLKGGWPYRDVWDLKPPGVYYTYAAMLALTGSHMAGVRACDLIAAVLTALLLRAALEPMVGAAGAWLAALLYPALYLRLGFWGMAQAESFANLWIVASLWAWLKGAGAPEFGRSGVEDQGMAPPLGFAVAAGLAAAAALLLKVTALPSLVAALGVVSLWRVRSAGRRCEARRWTGFLLGLGAPLAVTAGIMTASGAGAAYLDIQRGFVAGYVAMPEAARGAAAAGWHYFWRLYSAPTLVAAAGLLVITRPARLFLTLWLAAAVASVIMQRKYFGYHWTPVLLPLAGLAGAGLSGMSVVFGRLTRRQCSVTMLIGAVLIAGWSVERRANGYEAVVEVMTGRLPLARYWRQFGRPYSGDFSFIADTWAADYIRTRTRPGDPVYIWGFEPLTLFLADRRAPTRFVFAVPLVSRWTPSRWRAEFLRDLRAHPPVLFGVMRHDAIPHASGRTDDSTAQLQEFTELRDFLRHGYRRETTIEDLTLFRRQATDRSAIAPAKRSTRA